MNDDQLIAKIGKMNRNELLAEVIAFPEALTDGYYRRIGDAITKRYRELTANPPETSGHQEKET